MLGTESSQVPHDEVLERLDIGPGKLIAAPAEDLGRSFSAYSFKMQCAKISKSSFQHHGPTLFRLRKQQIEQAQIIVERFHLDILFSGEFVRIVEQTLELRWVEALHQRGDVENQYAEGIVNLEIEAGPVGIVEHQFDIGFFGHNFMEPALVDIVAEDAAIQVASLVIGNAIEIDAVQVLEGDGLVTVKAGGTNILKVMLGLDPPGIKFHSGLPRSDRLDPGQVAVAPQTGQIHSFTHLGF